MRSHEERVAETKRRIAKIEREKRLRRNTITMASAVAACLALLIGASLAMPGIAARIQTGDYSGFETAASIFHSGAALGYIVIGLLAFLLGVCVTVLCFRLRQMNREDDQIKRAEQNSWKELPPSKANGNQKSLGHLKGAKTTAR